mmetsp:Transcript_18311/g.27120  ORF Transcript_18311/g.27120 Transcript_18311/m.27120 type:complete len:948 (+) Transcript_18311:648-3491(+)
MLSWPRMKMGTVFFHLMMDLLLLPLSLPSPERRQTGISDFGLMRLAHRCGHVSQRKNDWKRKNQTRWTESAAIYIRHLKLAALRCAIWPVGNGLFQEKDQDKATVVSALASSFNSMHGRLGMDFINKSSKECSWAVACSLLILMIGDKTALLVLDAFLLKHQKSQIWESILGEISRDDFMQRPPLPVEVAEVVSSFLLTRKLPQRPINDKTKQYGKLLIDLCLALIDDSNGRISTIISLDEQKYRKFWCIKLVKSFYKQFVSFSIIDEEHPDEWASMVYQTCLCTSIEVLTIVVDIGQSNVEILRTTQNERPLGVPGPFRGRNDLNMLLNSHRESQKRRKLSSEDAIEARKAAYGFVSQFAALSIHDDRKPFELPILLLGCAVYEEESLQNCVTTALDCLLREYTRALETKKWRQVFGEKESLQHQAVPLLPSLLDAICADSEHAINSALKWIKGVLYKMDPQASYFLSSYLSQKTSTEQADVAQEMDISKSYTTFVDISEQEGTTLIKKEIDSRVNALAGEFGLNEETALAILIEFEFSLEASQRPSRENLEAIMDSLGLIPREDSNISDFGTAFCGICYEEMEGNNVFSIQCRHSFCRDCWHAFLDEASDQGNIRFLKMKCPQHDCRARLMANEIQKLDRQQYLKWQKALLERFVQSDPLYRFCPGPDCNFVGISSIDGNHKLCSSKCEHCSTTFCFQCGAPPHEPANCDHVAEWQRLVGNSSFWLKKNAKPCPGCNAPIEKNMGCNHMTCQNCETEFCWLCLKKLRVHLEAHTCNKYEPGGDDDIERRAVFLANRFQAHEEAEIFAQKQYKKFPENPTVSFITDDNYDTLLHAVSFSIDSRHFVKNSYITSFGLRNNAKMLAEYESHQGALEMLTERLSQLTELNLQRLYQEKGERCIVNYFNRISFYRLSIASYMKRVLDLASVPTNNEDSSKLCNDCTKRSI